MLSNANEGKAKLMLSNFNPKQSCNKQNWEIWLKDGRTTTTVILASRAAPPHAAGSQK